MPNNFIQYNPGDKIGKCTYVENVSRPPGRKDKFQCTCGNVFISQIHTVKQGWGCGCGIGNSFKHGHSKSGKSPGTSEYGIWKEMKQRTGNTKWPRYSSYGGRGIKICERWVGENGYQNFINDMGSRPSKEFSIDRIDNNGNYEPPNCRWATQKEQCRNRRDNRIVEYNGESMTLVELAERYSLKYYSLSQRIIRLKWSVKRAVEQPVKVQRKLPMVGGKEMRLCEWAEYLGITIQRLGMALKKRSLEDCISYYKNKFDQFKTQII